MIRDGRVSVGGEVQSCLAASARQWVEVAQPRRSGRGWGWEEMRLIECRATQGNKAAKQAVSREGL
jgi:hypothetical protein